MSCYKHDYLNFMKFEANQPWNKMPQHVKSTNDFVPRPVVN